MASKVKPIPDGYHTVTPYLIVEGVPKLIEFLKKAFNAEVVEEIKVDGMVTHAEVKIGSSMIMMGEARGEHTPMPSMFYLYVEDTDATYKQAVAAGGISVMEPTDQFYGDRNGGVKDHCGNQWWIGTRQEEISKEELQKRTEQKMLQKAN
jgi:PhnB protein